MVLSGTSRFAAPALVGLVALGTLAASPSGRADAARARVVLHSVAIELPTDEGPLPDGPGVETANNNCLGCHSAGMVLTQPALPRAVWDAEVRKMINVFKAPVSPEDAATIINYLARTKGAG